MPGRWVIPARGAAGQAPGSVQASPPPFQPRARRDPGSFVPGRYFSPGGLEEEKGVGPGAEMPCAEVLLIHTNSYSGLPSLIRNRPVPSSATAETKAVPGWTNPFPIRVLT